jgi:hypothetical protein
MVSAAKLHEMLPHKGGFGLTVKWEISGRVHLYRWGDGGAHFHVWMLPRPLGMIDAQGMMLPLWEDVMPNVPDETLAEAAQRIAAAM